MRSRAPKGISHAAAVGRPRVPDSQAEAWSDQGRPSRLMHLAQSTFRTSRPFSRTLTFCRFGRNLRFVALIEKLRLCPKVVVLPQ